MNQPITWTRCAPSEPYYEHGPTGLVASQKLQDIQERFDKEIVQRNARDRAARSPFDFPVRRPKLPQPHKCCSHGDSEQHSCESDDDFDSDDSEDDNAAFEELQRKQTHPWRLHDDLWYNNPGEMNDGPVCRCSQKAQKTGIRHGIYLGEEFLLQCDPNSNNVGALHHYRIVIEPMTNYQFKFPTKINYDNHDFVFEGFSLLAHNKLGKFPPCRLIRYNIEYSISIEEEKFPVNFTVRDLDLISDYIFKELLELVDLDWRPANADPTSCPRFHLFPRFSRLLEEDGKELLAPAIILNYLLTSSQKVISDEVWDRIADLTDDEWATLAKAVKDQIIMKPGDKPCAIRVDQIDRSPEGSDKSEATGLNTKQEASSEFYRTEASLELGELDSSPPSRSDPEESPVSKKKPIEGPVIVHFGMRPPQLSYAGNPKYQKAWRDYVKFRHLLANKPKVSAADRKTLAEKEELLQEMRLKSDMKRYVTVEVSAKDCYKTGIYCDIIQYSLLVPVVICHLRFHQSLVYLEKEINYNFQDRYLLQLALTHPSYRENFGTNPDHARNALTNCGIRQPTYGDKKIHYVNTRKRGINMLVNIMSKFGCSEETSSNINHNERLEFLGDAVVEFLSSIHLYFMFPDLEEGGLATYRAAIVQNQHLALLAKKLHLERYMLYAHGSDLCHDLELRHAMANCFEALMGALFLDGGINVADRVFSYTLFGDNPVLHDVWVNYPKHPLQQQEPEGDRNLIEKVPRLQELVKFEELTGIQFTHIRLLARAFTHRSVGFNHLTLGSNQRMEFLGDTVLQLVASEYLYKYFPEHHEGHLSLLRSSLVNNKTQAVVCDDLGMTEFATYKYTKGELKGKDRANVLGKTKDHADLLEAFLGALYVDKGLLYCRTFCEVCFFPRLEHFIMNQDWNDPKSKLQQCCLTLRSIDGSEPDIPIYKVIESLGPTNTRIYRVAVYFRSKRLAEGQGHSIQEAEMAAATKALQSSKELFPQLSHQRRVIERSVMQQEPGSSQSLRDKGHSSRNSDQGNRERHDQPGDKSYRPHPYDKNSTKRDRGEGQRTRERDGRFYRYDRNGSGRSSGATRTEREQRYPNPYPSNRNHHQEWHHQEWQHRQVEKRTVSREN